MSGRVRRLAPGSRGHEIGFTLLELLVVIILLAIVSAVAIPMLSSSTNEASLSAAAEEIVSALEYARRASMGTEMNCLVSIDASADTLSVAHRVVNPHAWDELRIEVIATDIDSMYYEPMRHPVQKHLPYRVLCYEEPRWTGIDVQNVDFGGNAWVKYDRFGEPSSGGEVTLERGGVTVSILVDGRTGRASIGGGG